MENSPLQDRPPLKTFTPKLPDLPVLKNYGVPAKETYWEKFPKNFNLHSKSPYVLNSTRIRELAVEANVTDMVTVNAVIE